MPCVPNARPRCKTEQRNLDQDIIRWTQKQVFAITRKTLADLAGHEPRGTHGRRIRPAACVRLTGEAKEQLATAFKSSNHR